MSRTTPWVNSRMGTNAIEEVEAERLEEHRQEMIATAKKRKKDKAKSYRQAKKTESNKALEDSKKLRKPDEYEYDNLYRVFTFRDEPINIEELAKQMLAYARREMNPRSGDVGGFSLEDFCYETGYKYTSLLALISKFPRLTVAYEYMKLAFAERRDKGATLKAYDPTWTARTIGFFSPRHVSEQERLAKLQAEAAARAKEQLNKEPINITIKTTSGLGE